MVRAMSTIRGDAPPAAHAEVGSGLQAGLDAPAPIDAGIETWEDTHERTPLLQQDNEESQPEPDYRAGPRDDAPTDQKGLWQTWRRPSVSASIFDGQHSAPRLLTCNRSFGFFHFLSFIC